MAGLELPSRVASPPADKPLLLFDGDCGFCRLWIERWRRMTGDRLDYAPSQEAGKRFPEISPETFARSVVLVGTGGEVTAGAEAVFRALAMAPCGGFALWAYRHVPAVAAFAEAAYRLVAGHRVLFSRLTRIFWGRRIEKPLFGISLGIFLRLMGFVYLVAFLSLGSQVRGLVGSHGILPAGPFLDAVRSHTGPERYWLAPTLCWISASDGFLQLLCGGGALLSVLALLGVAPAPCFFLLWLGYLSLAVVCREFLGYQWDNLLLEAGFLCILLSPLRARVRLALDDPSRGVAFLLKWLLFRLMFSSGVVKLASGDPNWRNLTALTYHYQTQCLPSPVSWYAHHLPLRFHEASCFLMFAIELGAPLLIFAPRRPRYLAFGALVGLQLLIALTGNYAFFNLLAIALCVLLLDDAAWPERWRAWLQAPRHLAAGGAGSGAVISRVRDARRLPGRWPVWIVGPAGIVIFLVSSMTLAGAFRHRVPWPRPAMALAKAISPLRSVNGYGLFAVMTTSRPEIIVEGSDDGVAWQPYEFKWKPGELMRRPAWVAPHQPRLDWQMWFAALEDYRANPWFFEFLGRLLQGSPEVLALLERNPFPAAPPRYLRGSLYDYRFTDRGGPADQWWVREYKGPYGPVLSLKQAARPRGGTGT